MNTLSNDMEITHPFAGQKLGEPCELGEGCGYDPLNNRVWWFDIKGRRIYEWVPGEDAISVQVLPVMASALAVIDKETQLIVAEDAFYLRKGPGARLTHALAFGRDVITRSNDSRMHPSGALWTSRIGRHNEPGVGGFFHLAGETLTSLYSNVGIPNAICFSPDGAMGYFIDSHVQKLMRVALDPATGLPVGDPQMLNDARQDAGRIDGAICDAEGRIHTARWGGGSVDVLSPEGQKIARYEVPARQVTCPAFYGPNADRLFVTSAHDGVSDSGRASDPDAGYAFTLDIAVNGRLDPFFRLG
ncbi:SMP-30/gluconolactonase/LRE family protein [Falsirhodobacter sp. alg1]|uniref:SMP-30/gluconolactonase/LRE family protein n=1 Tax=Falsirhodobacter sp. alg1 TaxID=1472418 RepID=UPI0009E9BF42|nr:SMP-30/gluconolactonase/LRE family protein [Falsirhodobacter sp. alg1]